MHTRKLSLVVDTVDHFHPVVDTLKENEECAYHQKYGGFPMTPQFVCYNRPHFVYQIRQARELKGYGRAKLVEKNNDHDIIACTIHNLPHKFISMHNIATCKIVAKFLKHNGEYIGCEIQERLVESDHDDLASIDNEQLANLFIKKLDCDTFGF